MRKPLLVMSLSSSPSPPRRPAPSPTPAPRAPVPIRLSPSPSDIVRACEDDYFYDVYGEAVGKGVVHFMGTTGIDYRAFNMADKCTTFSATTPADPAA
jgi:hypothetical protein